MQTLRLTIFKKNKSDDLNGIIDSLGQLIELCSEFKGACEWYLTGETKKEALAKKISTNGTILAEGRMKLSSELNDFPASTIIWNTFDDIIFCTNYVQSNVDNFQYELTCKIENHEQVISFVNSTFRECFLKMDPEVMLLETNGYSLNKKKVFPDRLPVGWMIYIKNLNINYLRNFKENFEIIEGKNGGGGVLFKSKDGYFDGSNMLDIILANDMEIILASHDILPTFKNIFK